MYLPTTNFPTAWHSRFEGKKSGDRFLYYKDHWSLSGKVYPTLPTKMSMGQ